MIMIMKDRLQGIGLQHKRIGTPLQHFENGATVMAAKIGFLDGGLQPDKDDAKVNQRFQFEDEPADRLPSQ